MLKRMKIFIRGQIIVQIRVIELYFVNVISVWTIRLSPPLSQITWRLPQDFSWHKIVAVWIMNYIGELSELIYYIYAILNSILYPRDVPSAFLGHSFEVCVVWIYSQLVIILLLYYYYTTTTVVITLISSR